MARLTISNTVIVSSMRSNSALLLATLIDGTGLQPIQGTCRTAIGGTGVMATDGAGR